MSITGFLVIFFRLGFFTSTQVLLAKCDDLLLKRGIIGSSLLIGLIIGIFFSLFLLLASYYVDSIFKINFGYLLALFSPLCFILPITLLVPSICIGSNRLRVMAFYTFATQALFLLLQAIFFLANSFSIETVLLSQLTSSIIISIVVFWYLKPSFKNVKQNLSAIIKKNKLYGKKIYFSQIITQGSYKIDGFLISLFVSTLWLGFYSLTLSLLMPALALSNTLSDRLFKDFTKQHKINNLILTANFVWLTSFVVIIWLISDELITIVFSEEFLPAKQFILPIGAAIIFQGTYQPLNRFLTAHEQGSYQKRAAITMGLFNIAVFTSLIPIFGAMGAAYALTLSKAYGLCVHWYYYQKTINKLII